MKVKFIGGSKEQINFGRGLDPYEKSLVEGQVYEVQEIEQHSWHTIFSLILMYMV